MHSETKLNNRKSLRLKGYDYSKAGLYFVTICVYDRECLFGKITDGKMTSTDVGKIADEFWLNIPQHFSNIVLHEHIIMPNHVHGIIQLTDVNDANSVGACHGMPLQNTTDIPVGTRHGVSPQHGTPQKQNDAISQSSTRETQFGKPVSGSVSVIVNQYKSSVKRWCNKNNNAHFRWQSRFHDHIIRYEQSYQNISEYIINNVANWKDDKFFNLQ